MDIGDTSIVHVEFFDRNGALADPTLVQAWTKDPDGAVESLTIGKISTGIYESTLSVSKEGDYWVRVEGTGAIKTAVEKKVHVTTRNVVYA